VQQGQHRPGDIVMYANTYGNYRPGVITHVGVVSGTSKMIHRPTKDQPVMEDSLNLFHIAEIRRPRALGSAAHSPTSHAVKIFKHDGKASAVKAAVPVSGLEVKITIRGGVVRATVDGMEVNPASLELQMFY